jgi:hypothetical protein
MFFQVRAMIRDSETEEKEKSSTSGTSNNSAEDNTDGNEEEEEDANGEEEEDVAVDDDGDGQALADEINAYLVLGQDSQQGGNNKENKQKR